MRKILSAIVIGMMAIASYAQDSVRTTEEFLNDFKGFVVKYEQDSLKSMPDSVRVATYEQFKKDYTDTYRAKMTQEQLNEYSKYKGRYSSVGTKKQIKSVTNEVDSAANKFANQMERVSNEVGGFLKGIFGSSKSDSTKSKKSTK